MEEESVKIKPHAREHLANERTYLAWIRTSIGIMAFGFVVVKFSLFINEFSVLIQKNSNVPMQQHGYSAVIGISLVAFGAVLLFISFINYKRTQKQLNEGSYQSSSRLIGSITFILMVISLMLIAYLIENTIR